MKTTPKFPMLFPAATALSLLASSLFSLAQTASELDSFLAAPVPSSPISEEIARQTIEKGEALANSDSSRKEEIDAFLIPFKRVLGSQAPKAEGEVPHPKPFILFKSSDGTTEAFKASSMTTQGEFIVAESPEGKKGMWEKNRFAAQLPWYLDQEMETGTFDLDTLALRYKALQSTFPAAKNLLQSEMDRILAVKRKLAAAAEKKKASLNENAQRMITEALSYSPDHPYTKEELAHTLLAAEQASQGAPELAPKITRVMEPLRTHFENLLAGKTYEEGVWRPKALVEERRARKKQEEDLRSFESSLDLQASGESLSRSEIQNLLTGLTILGVVVFILGLYLLLGKAALAVRIAGVLCCLSPACLWILANIRLSTPYPSSPSFQIEKPEGISQVLRLLFLASQDNPQVLGSDRRITLREADLNSFLKDHVRFVSSPEQQQSSICRTDLALQLLSEEVVIWELAQYKGRSLRIRYDFKTKGIGSDLKIADSSVVIGNLPLPRSVATKMINRLSAELTKIFRLDAVQQSYKITRLTEGEADLTSIPRTALSPAPAEAASAPAAAIPAPASLSSQPARSDSTSTSTQASYFGSATPTPQ
jgi:hypothetical protein